MYNEELDSVGRKPRIASLVAHGAIQRYIDYLFDFYWLYRGFIIFLQAHIIDEVFYF